MERKPKQGYGCRLAAQTGRRQVTMDRLAAGGGSVLPADDKHELGAQAAKLGAGRVTDGPHRMCIIASWAVFILGRLWRIYWATWRALRPSGGREAGRAPPAATTCGEVASRPAACRCGEATSRPAARRHGEVASRPQPHVPPWDGGVDPTAAAAHLDAEPPPLPPAATGRSPRCRPRRRRHPLRPAARPDADPSHAVAAWLDAEGEWGKNGGGGERERPVDVGKTL
uniref:DUF834 domain-containing protein n=1 Tax=Oryza rufipogon TaxID=4529 RepID=A0A2I4S628_ORYRU|nr:hypothetical protein YJ_17 [Oryza rufipogon]